MSPAKKNHLLTKKELLVIVIGNRIDFRISAGGTEILWISAEI